MPIWVISLLLSYAHKIPFIGKIVKILALWYGRTTWWKILVKIRKFIIIVNSIIGVCTVFKFANYGAENIIAGLYGMGGVYIEMFTSLIKRLFNWFFELFDHTIVPKAPESRPKAPDFFKWGHRDFTWATKPMNNDGATGRIMNIAEKSELFKSPFKLFDSTPTSRADWNFTSWLWYAGICILGIGAIYLGYMIYTDPTFSLVSASDIKGKAPVYPKGGGGFTGTASSPDITITDVRGATTSASSSAGAFGEAIANTSNKISSLFKTTISYLNPLSYYTTEAEQTRRFQNFLDAQATLQHYDTRYYPFTEVNPYASYYDRLKMLFFGESDAAKSIRLQAKSFVDASLVGFSSLNDVSGAPSGVATPNSVTAIGLGTPTSTLATTGTHTIWDMVKLAQIDNKLKALSQTPLTTPAFGDTVDLSVPTALPPTVLGQEWVGHEAIYGPDFVQPGKYYSIDGKMHIKPPIEAAQVALAPAVETSTHQIPETIGAMRESVQQAVSIVSTSSSGSTSPVEQVVENISNSLSDINLSYVRDKILPPMDDMDAWCVYAAVNRDILDSLPVDKEFLNRVVETVQKWGENEILHERLQNALNLLSQEGLFNYDSATEARAPGVFLVSLKKLISKLAAWIRAARQLQASSKTPEIIYVDAVRLLDFSYAL
jgi:hypothetical protein